MKRRWLRTGAPPAVDEPKPRKPARPRVLRKAHAGETTWTPLQDRNFVDLSADEIERIIAAHQAYLRKAR